MQVSEQQIERFVQFADKRNDMVQDGKSQEIDENGRAAISATNMGGSAHWIRSLHVSA